MGFLEVPLTQTDRILVMCDIRLSSCISNIDSKSFMRIVEALIQGETDPNALVSNCQELNIAI